jgi:hypothetical protein
MCITTSLDYVYFSMRARSVTLNMKSLRQICDFNSFPTVYSVLLFITHATVYCHRIVGFQNF